MQTCPSCGELVPTEYVVCVWCGYDLTAEHIRRSGITIGRQEAFDRMRRVITDPLNTMKEISLLPDLVGGKWIFYLIGVMMTLNMIAIFNKLDGLAFNSSETTVNISGISIPLRTILNLAFLIAQPIVLFLIFYVIWKIAARIMSIFARSVGGTGNLEKIRAVIGYSMVPVLLAWTVAWLFRLISPATEPSSVSFDGVENAVISIAEQGFFGVVSMLFLYIGWIWAIVLGIIGMKNASRLSWIEAIFVAGIPYVLFMTIAL